MKFSLAVLSVAAGSEVDRNGDSNGMCFSKHHEAVFPCLAGLHCCGAGSTTPSCYYPAVNDCAVCGDVALVCAKGQTCAKVGASTACIWAPPTPRPTPRPTPHPRPTPQPTPEPASEGVPLLHMQGANFKGPMIEVEIGKQVVSVLLDSGSGTLAVNKGKGVSKLPECDGNKQNYLSGKCVVGAYDPSSSTTEEDFPATSAGGCSTPVPVGGVNKCGASASYGDESAWDGYLVTDEVKIGKLSAKVTFASVTEYFDGPGGATMQEAPANGIMGVTGEPIVPGYSISNNCLPAHHTDTQADPTTCQEDAFNAVLKQNKLPNVYGVCLGGAPSDLAPSDAADLHPGLMTLGKSDATLFKGKMLYAPIDDMPYYNVQVEGWGLGGALLSQAFEQDPVQYSQAGTVDTGTNHVYLPQSVHAKLTADRTCATDDDCLLTLQLTGEKKQSMCLQLAGPELFTCKKGKCQAGGDIVQQSKADDKSTMLGFPALSHAYLEFDRQNGRVGFAERSDKACKPECSAYLSQDTCQVADGCEWSSKKCSGSASGGNLAAGSKVTAGPCQKSFDIIA